MEICARVAFFLAERGHTTWWLYEFMKVLEIRVHARRRGHVKIKKINYRKVSKYRIIST